MIKNFFINCDQATTICDKSQYAEATLFEKIKLQLHFIRCRFCVLYTKQNRLITKICNQHLNKEKFQHTNCLTEQDKRILKKQLEYIENKNN